MYSHLRKQIFSCVVSIPKGRKDDDASPGVTITGPLLLSAEWVILSQFLTPFMTSD